MSPNDETTEGVALVVTYPREAVLTKKQVAAGLQLKRAQSVDALNLPTIPLGRLPRYVWGQVLDELTSRARKVA